MKPLILFIFIVTLISFQSSAQENVETIAETKIPECEVIANTSSVFFVRLMQKSQYDSAKQILNYWEGKCGVREPVFRAKLIIALSEHRGIDALIDDETLYHLSNYIQRLKMIESRNFSEYHYGKHYYGFVPIAQEFDSFTINFFKKVIKDQKPNTSSYLLCELYSHESDSLFIKLYNGQYENTSLAKHYKTQIKRTGSNVEGNYAFLTGIWIPTGALSTLGNHPQMGVQIGGKSNRLNFDLTLMFKFIKSKNGYYATRTSSDKSVVYTEKFFGGYFGVDLGYDILQKKKNEIQLLTGIGYDGFDAIKEDKKQDLESESVSSYNFNFGLGYRYYVNQSFYIGLQAKYNMVDYTLNNVIDFTGNPITFTLVLGTSTNNRRYAFDEYRYMRRH